MVWLVEGAVSIHGGESCGADRVYLAVRVPPLTSRTRTLCEEVDWTREVVAERVKWLALWGNYGYGGSDVGIYELSVSVAYSRGDHWWNNPNCNCISLLGPLILVLSDAGTDSDKTSGLHILLYGTLLGRFERNKRAVNRILVLWLPLQ